MKRLLRIGEGATANVYLCLFTLGFRRALSVVKEIHIEDDMVLCENTGNVRGMPHSEVVFGGKNEIHWSLQSHTKDDATQICRASSWKTECVVSHALMFVNRYLPSPVFTIIREAWTTEKKRYVCMPFAGTTLGYLSLPPKMFQSIILQVMVGLAWAQHRAHFKHHDLHSDNVFVTSKRVPKMWPLPNGRIVMLPDTTVSASIADYGQSSVTFKSTRFTRIDVHDLDLSRKWGSWNSILQGNEGYDMAVLLKSLEEDCDDSEVENLEFLQRVESAMKDLCPYTMSKFGRPYSKIGVTIVDTLQHPLLRPFLQDAAVDSCDIGDHESYVGTR
jgi:serine/threonine protein kinase